MKSLTDIINSEWTSRVTPRRLCIAATAVLFLAVAGLLSGAGSPAQFSPEGAQTELYWTHAHELAGRVDAIPACKRIEEVVTQLQTIQEDLDGLSTVGVDQLAIDATAHFRRALRSARLCADHLKWMEDHQIRTVVSIVVGGEVIEKLCSRLGDLCKNADQAHEVSIRSYLELTSKYPNSTFAMPLPPDLQPVREVLLKINSLKQAEETISDLYQLLWMVLAAL